MAEAPRGPRTDETGAGQAWLISPGSLPHTFAASEAIRTLMAMFYPYIFGRSKYIVMALEMKACDGSAARVPGSACDDDAIVV